MNGLGRINISVLSAAKLLLFAGLSLTASCATSFDKTKKPDAVSGATPHYSGGDRGALPVASSDYEVLGIKDGIKNWSIKYDRTLVRGGEFYDDKVINALREWNIKTVVSISPSDHERALCRKYGLVLVEILFDKKTGPSSADLHRFLQTIKTGTGPFYVHCVGGTHRAGVLGVAYRMHILNWPYEKAVLEFGQLGGDLKADHSLLEPVKAFKP